MKQKELSLELINLVKLGVSIEEAIKATLKVNSIDEVFCYTYNHGNNPHYGIYRVSDFEKKEKGWDIGIGAEYVEDSEAWYDPRGRFFYDILFFCQTKIQPVQNFL